MKIKRARRYVKQQVADLARKQFEEFTAGLKPGLWARIRGFFSLRYKSEWRERRVTAFIRWQNARLKRLQKKAERRISYGKG
jgi:hypothetical protein